MSLANAIIKFEQQGDSYSITLSELTKEQFDEVLKTLGIPVIWVVGRGVNDLVCDNFERGEQNPLSNWPSQSSKIPSGAAPGERPEKA